MSLASSYEKRVPILENVADEIERLLKEILRGIPQIDRIYARTKSLDRFLEKAARKTAQGELKYPHPLEEIQDQIGARIVVFYKSNTEPAAERILLEFRQVEDRLIEERDPEAFSYEARHLVCLIPPDIQNQHNPPIDFFELQISTLFQHAWSEANHDLGYKSVRELEYGDRKRIAWAAAQAWGADVIFDELWERLHSNDSRRRKANQPDPK